MRNINEYNRIKVINVEERVADVEAGTGTYREILDKVMANEIIPIVTASGAIVGISYDSKVTNLIEDNIAQVAFEKRYRGIDVMGYVFSALDLKARNAVIADVQEDAQGIRVILENGEVVTVKEYGSTSHCGNVAETSVLPHEVEISYEEARNLGIEIGGDVNKSVLKYLREKYNHYLSGNYAAPDIECDDEAEVIKVMNICWGRKR